MIIFYNYKLFNIFHFYLVTLDRLCFKKIFDYLILDDVINLSRTNHFFKSICKEDYFERIKKLELSNIENIPEELSGCKNLEEVRMEILDFTVRDLNILLKFEKITKIYLKLYDVTLSTEEECLFVKFKTIKELSINVVRYDLFNVIKNLIKCKDLIVLKLDENLYLNRRILDIIITNFKNLEFVSLRDTSLMDFEIIVLIRGLNSLKTIDLKDCIRITNELNEYVQEFNRIKARNIILKL